MSEDDKLDAQAAIMEALEGIEEVLSVLAVSNMRNYDILMSILNDRNPEAAAQIHHIHESGGLVGSLPVLDIPGHEDDTK